MSGKKYKRFIREGDYIAEVEVELTDDDPPGSGWGPYLNSADALKIDDVRTAMRAGDFATAAKMARVYRLMPVPAA